MFSPIIPLPAMAARFKILSFVIPLSLKETFLKRMTTQLLWREIMRN